MIDAYRLAREEMPDVQLALVGSMAHRRPARAGSSSTRSMADADGDADIHILNNLNNVGNIEVNAFQRTPTW